MTNFLFYVTLFLTNSFCKHIFGGVGMKKACKILLIISAIAGFVAFVVFVASAIADVKWMGLSVLGLYGVGLYSLAAGIVSLIGASRLDAVYGTSKAAALGVVVIIFCNVVAGTIILADRKR